MLKVFWLNWFCSVQGDAGGPLVVRHRDKWVQAGVTTYLKTDSCKVSNVPDGYTNVSNYQFWILGHVNSRSPGFIEAGTSQLVSFSVDLLVAVSLFVSLFQL